MTTLLNSLLWFVIGLLAFSMQVMPFLLVLTLISISFGISSGVALIIIPLVLFAMLVIACCYVSRRARKGLPAPSAVYRNKTDDPPDHWKGLVTCMLPHSRAYRMR